MSEAESPSSPACWVLNSDALAGLKLLQLHYAVHASSTINAREFAEQLRQATKDPAGVLRLLERHQLVQRRTVPQIGNVFGFDPAAVDEAIEDARRPMSAGEAFRSVFSDEELARVQHSTSNLLRSPEMQAKSAELARRQKAMAAYFEASRRPLVPELAEDQPKAPRSQKKNTLDDIISRLLVMKRKGAKYTSQRSLAEELACSNGIVAKALQNNDELAAWAYANKPDTSPVVSLAVDVPHTDEGLAAVDEADEAEAARRLEADPERAEQLRRRLCAQLRAVPQRDRAAYQEAIKQAGPRELLIIRDQLQEAEPRVRGRQRR